MNIKIDIGRTKMRWSRSGINIRHQTPNTDIENSKSSNIKIDINCVNYNYSCVDYNWVNYNCVNYNCVNTIVQIEKAEGKQCNFETAWWQLGHNKKVITSQISNRKMLLWWVFRANRLWKSCSRVHFGYIDSWNRAVVHKRGVWRTRKKHIILRWIVLGKRTVRL